MLDFCYRLLTHMGRSPVRILLARRLAAGKEDPARWTERKGKTRIARPSGPLVWFHAASAGESLSLLPLLDRLAQLSPAPAILITTGTLTSARLLSERLAHKSGIMAEVAQRPAVIHQYIPYDRPRWVKRFLDHWQPDIGIWIESELWPNLLHEVHKRRIPAVLLNGRMSQRSHKRWRLAKKWAAKLLSPFALVLTQSEGDVARFQELGAFPVSYAGNLRSAALPPPVDADNCVLLRQAIGGRPCWLFASTHEGEEEIALALHKRLAAKLPRLLTIIAPRHPRRSDDIKSLIRNRGLRFATRSAGELPGSAHDIYLADTLGEMGLFYSASPLSVIGASFVPKGGHNAVEPALLGSAIIFGPHMQNHAAIANSLLSADAAIQVNSERELADCVADLLTSPGRTAALAAAARLVTARDAGTIDRVMLSLTPLLRSIGLRARSLPAATLAAQNGEPGFPAPPLPSSIRNKS